MRRREFLVRTGVGVGVGGAVGLLSSCGAGGPPGAGAQPAAAPAAPRSGAWTWEEIKAQFAVDAGLVHMTSFFLAAHPRPVREAIERHRRALDENPVHYLEDNAARFEKSLRRAAADYFEAGPDDFAITDSTTMGLGLVYGGLVLRDGQEILTTTHDHIVTQMALKHRADRTGAKLRQVTLYRDPASATVDEIVGTLERSLKPSTRVVAVTWVHSGTGVKLPIRRMAGLLERINARRDEKDHTLLCVDGVHGFGIEAETARSLGCDFFIAGTHKWILGPRGTGLVWARPTAWPVTAPTIPTMDPFWREGEPEAMPPAAWMTPGGFQPFEHRWAVEQAFRFHLEIGKQRIAARIHELNRMCKAELARIPRVRIATPTSEELSSGIICFDVDGMDPYQVVSRLRASKIVASVVPSFYKPLHVRLAPSLLTLEADVERSVAAVRALG
jgi:isopenicillin-N epimerase